MYCGLVWCPAVVPLTVEDGVGALVAEYFVAETSVVAFAGGETYTHRYTTVPN